jgi:hypothetical protein
VSLGGVKVGVVEDSSSGVEGEADGSTLEDDAGGGGSELDSAGGVLSEAGGCVSLVEGAAALSEGSPVGPDPGSLEDSEGPGSPGVCLAKRGCIVHLKREVVGAVLEEHNIHLRGIIDHVITIH